MCIGTEEESKDWGPRHHNIQKGRRIANVTEKDQSVQKEKNQACVVSWYQVTDCVTGRKKESIMSNTANGFNKMMTENWPLDLVHERF